jgi:hypothetical protein
MRKAFHQYLRPPQEELGKLWQQGLLSFDASVLLNIYGYSKKTRDDLVEFIEKHSARVRLPHQFGLEFARNRSSVIVKQVHNYLRVEEALRKIMTTEIAPKRDHPFLSKKSTRAFQAIMDELEESRKAMEKLVGSDPYADRIFDIFEGKVGTCPTSEERLRLETEAQARYDKLTPPGFADIKEKGAPDGYGDCIAWQQLMEIAAKEKKGAILVTDDVKEDWWLLERGRTLGPRPELLEEFTRVTEQRFYMYTSENFLRAAREFTSDEIREDVLEEVSQRLADNVAALNALLYKPTPHTADNLALLDAYVSKLFSTKTESVETVKGSATQSEKGVAANDLKQPAAAVADSTPGADKQVPPEDLR